MVSGVVLTVVEPHRFDGQVLSFHFDYGAEKWDHWYKPDRLYLRVHSDGLHRAAAVPV